MIKSNNIDIICVDSRLIQLTSDVSYKMGKSNSKKQRSRRYRVKCKRDRGLGSCKSRLRAKNKNLTKILTENLRDEKDQTPPTGYVVKYTATTWNCKFYSYIAIVIVCSIATVATVHAWYPSLDPCTYVLYCLNKIRRLSSSLETIHMNAPSAIINYNCSCSVDCTISLYIYYRQNCQPATCTKATAAALTTNCSRQNLRSRLPLRIRKLQWSTLQKSIGDNPLLLGKGVFGKCFFGSIGPLRVCIKIFRLNHRYKKYFCNEACMLSKLCHENLPWLFAVCQDERHSILVMSHHAFRGEKQSVTVHAALEKQEAITFSSYLTVNCWKNILFGMTSALVYLFNNKILHNDITADNVVIEYLAPDFISCRSVIVDFGKACLLSDASLYNLTPEEQSTYKNDHPQIAPEVRNGLSRQSYKSDIYSFGRVLKKINSAVLKIPVLFSLSEQCIDHSPQERPTSEELHIFFSNLFSTHDNE